MTKFAIRQHKDRKGRFMKRADVWLFDRRDPKGVVYAECNDRAHAEKVVANEVKAFQHHGMPVRVVA